MTIYYIDSINGSDSYNGLNGTYSSGVTGPKKTYESIRAGIIAGDTILFNRGMVYHLTVDGLSTGASTFLNLTVGNNITHDSYGTGNRPVIYTYGAIGWSNRTGIIIQNLEFFHNTTTSIAHVISNTASSSGDQITINNCKFGGLVTAMTSRGYIRYNGVGSITVTNCYFDMLPSSIGIFLQGGTAAGTLNVLIQNNQFIANSTAGASYANAIGCCSNAVSGSPQGNRILTGIISNNTVDLNLTSYVYGDSNTISGVNGQGSAGSAGNGILIRSICKDLLITQNTFNKCWVGVDIGGCSRDYLYTGSSLYDHLIYGNLGNTIISNNTSTNCLMFGMSMMEGSNATFRGNIITNCGGGTQYYYGRGIEIFGITEKLNTVTIGGTSGVQTLTIGASLISSKDIGRQLCFWDAANTMGKGILTAVASGTSGTVTISTTLPTTTYGKADGNLRDEVMFSAKLSVSSGIANNSVFYVTTDAPFFLPEHKGHLIRCNASPGGSYQNGAAEVIDYVNSTTVIARSLVPFAQALYNEGYWYIATPCKNVTITGNIITGAKSIYDPSPSPIVPRGTEGVGFAFDDNCFECIGYGNLIKNCDGPAIWPNINFMCHYISNVGIDNGLNSNSNVPAYDYYRAAGVSMGSSCDGNIIANNLFMKKSTTTDAIYGIAEHDSSNSKYNKITNNIIYGYSTALKYRHSIYNNNSAYGYTTLSAQAGVATGSVNNTIVADPLTTGTTINKNSPCKNAGTFVGYYKDYRGMPFNNPPSIGPFEFTSRSKR